MSWATNPGQSCQASQLKSRAPRFPFPYRRAEPYLPVSQRLPRSGCLRESSHAMRCTVPHSSDAPGPARLVGCGGTVPRRVGHPACRQCALASTAQAQRGAGTRGKPRSGGANWRADCAGGHGIDTRRQDRFYTDLFRCRTGSQFTWFGFRGSRGCIPPVLITVMGDARSSVAVVAFGG